MPLLVCGIPWQCWLWLLSAILLGYQMYMPAGTAELSEQPERVTAIQETMSFNVLALLMSHACEQDTQTQHGVTVKQLRIVCHGFENALSVAHLALAHPLALVCRRRCSRLPPCMLAWLLPCGDTSLFLQPGELGHAVVRLESQFDACKVYDMGQQPAQPFWCCASCHGMAGGD